MHYFLFQEEYIWCQELNGFQVILSSYAIYKKIYFDLGQKYIPNCTYKSFISPFEIEKDISLFDPYII